MAKEKRDLFEELVVDASLPTPGVQAGAAIQGAACLLIAIGYVVGKLRYVKSGGTNALMSGALWLLLVLWR